MNNLKITETVQNRRGNGIVPPSDGLTSSVLPEVHDPELDVNSQTGVSTRSVHVMSDPKQKEPHWYAVRTTYGREKKAYDYIIQHEGIAYLPTMIVEKTIKGETKRMEVSRIPNIFFVYGCEPEVKQFVYDNRNLPFLRFYYKYSNLGTQRMKTPLIVPDKQIQTLRIICDAMDTDDSLLMQEEIKKFQKGERVRVKEGHFQGVEGIVARFRGQQRVGIVIQGLVTAITAYIPSAFLEKKKQKYVIT